MRTPCWEISSSGPDDVEEVIEPMEAVREAASNSTGSPTIVSLDSFERLYTDTIPNPSNLSGEYVMLSLYHDSSSL